MKPIFTINKRWLTGCLLLFITACGQREINTHALAETQANTLQIQEDLNATIAFDSIRANQIHVQSGDLIFRTGRDFTSEVMKKMSQKDKTYSHCGIANWENDTLFVYHALGGEWNPDGKIRRDPFSFFCNPYENRGFGVYRYQIDSNDIQKILDQSRLYYRQEIPFDLNFNLQSDDKMYCTEYIYKSILKSIGPVNWLQTTTLEKVEYVAPDNLFMNEVSQKINSVTFPQR